MRLMAYVLAITMMMSLHTNLLIGESEASSGRATFSVNSGSYYTYSLGNIDSGKELEIDYSAGDNIDVLLMGASEYSSWQSGNSGHIESGSDYNDDNDDYVFTTDSSDTYYLIFDNYSCVWHFNFSIFHHI